MVKRFALGWVLHQDDDPHMDYGQNSRGVTGYPVDGSKTVSALRRLP